jgi:nitroimidazol reductase NimA-like FMN-containing flavoprotein (pyridoxamine 5'-phosphate oxidase superfamily)
LAVTTDSGPRVLPIMHTRLGEVVYVHGSVANRTLREASGQPVCLAVTLLDALVLARSAFHHSMNYRSVVVYGTAGVVVDPDEKRSALDAIVERSAPGRAAEARPPTEAEMRSTLVLSIPLVEVSAKVRTGGPIDDEADMSWPVWAGIIPLQLVAGDPDRCTRFAGRIDLGAMEVAGRVTSQGRGQMGRRGSGGAARLGAWLTSPQPRRPA